MRRGDAFDPASATRRRPARRKPLGATPPSAPLRRQTAGPESSRRCAKSASRSTSPMAALLATNRRRHAEIAAGARGRAAWAQGRI